MLLQNPAAEMTIKWSLSVQSRHRGSHPPNRFGQAGILGGSSHPLTFPPTRPSVSLESCYWARSWPVTNVLDPAPGRAGNGPSLYRVLVSSVGSFGLLFSLNTLFVNTVLCVGKRPRLLKNESVDGCQPPHCLFTSLRYGASINRDSEHALLPS